MKSPEHIQHKNSHRVCSISFFDNLSSNLTWKGQKICKFNQKSSKFFFWFVVVKIDCHQLILVFDCGMHQKLVEDYVLLVLYNSEIFKKKKREKNHAKQNQRNSSAFLGSYSQEAKSIQTLITSLW